MMPIPDFQTMMLPLLEFASDGEEHSIHEAVESLASHFSLSEEDKSRLLPSGQQPIFYNGVGWARTYLKKARLIDDPRRGYFLITRRGKEVLQRSPDRIDMRYLREFPEYIEFRETTREAADTSPVEEDLDELTPEEALEEAYQKIREGLSDEVLKAVINSSPGFFEKLVVELLVKMGYGGSRRDAARAVGVVGMKELMGLSTKTDWV